MAHCIVSLPSRELAKFVKIAWLYENGSEIMNQSMYGSQEAQRIQVYPNQATDALTIIKTIVVDPLLSSDQGLYSCEATFFGKHVYSDVAREYVYLEVLIGMLYTCNSVPCQDIAT